MEITMQNQAIKKEYDVVGKDNINRDKVTQFLTFVLNNEAYGVNILNIKEIIDFGKVTHVPMTPDFIAGVINLRGSVVPVIDLALRFSQVSAQKTKRSSVVILDVKYDGQDLEDTVRKELYGDLLYGDEK